MTPVEPPCAAEPVIQVRRLSKVFRDFWHRPKVTAVRDLDLDVHAGEIFGLLGPNGSGKSTTLKILLGLLHPSSGCVRVLGRPPRDVRAKRHIGYLPEDSHLYGYLTPRETLAFYGRLFDIGAGERRERIEQLLDMVGLAHAADRRIGEFSKGMARRIGLAQALINNPRLVVLDEPTAGLDPVGCRQIKDLMLTLARHGKTVVLSSHLLADVEDVCDRIVILYNGQIRAEGPVRRLLEQPDQVRFTIPNQPPDTVAALRQWLAQRVGSEPSVDRPSMDLEQYFLEVVQDAHRLSASPSGVAHATGLAPYLREREP